MRVLFASTQGAGLENDSYRAAAWRAAHEMRSLPAIDEFLRPFLEPR